MRGAVEGGEIDPVASPDGGGVDGGSPARAALPAPRRPAARRRPGVVALYFAYRALSALVLAAPVSLFAARLVGGHPRGDAVLFDPGSVMLVEVARVAKDAAALIAAQMGLGALLASAFGLIPLAIVIVALGRSGPLTASLVGGRVARALGPLTLLWGAALAAEVAAAALVTLLGLKLLGSMQLGPRAYDVAGAAVVLVAALAIAAIGILHDLARVAAVDEQRGFYMSASRALSTAVSAPLASAWAFFWRSALAVAALASAVGIARAVGLSSGARVALAFGAQHAGIAITVFLRVSWLAAAMRLLDRTREAGSGR
jgi:hypothetical protein